MEAVTCTCACHILIYLRILYQKTEHIGPEWLGSATIGKLRSFSIHLYIYIILYTQYTYIHIIVSSSTHVPSNSVTPEQGSHVWPLELHPYSICYSIRSWLWVVTRVDTFETQQTRRQAKQKKLLSKNRPFCNV